MLLAVLDVRDPETGVTWCAAAFIVVLGCSGATTRLPVPFERNGLWGYREDKGRVVVELRYLVAQEFLPGGIAAVADHEGWAYIDRQGRVVVRPYLFDNGPDPFSEGLARFRENGLFGFFDKKGRVVIGPRFEWVEPFRKGRARYGSDCAFEPIGEHGTARCKKWGIVWKSNGRFFIEEPTNAHEPGNIEKDRPGSGH